MEALNWWSSLVHISFLPFFGAVKSSILHLQYPLRLEPLPTVPLPTILGSHRARSSAPGLYSSFPLASYFTHSGVYMAMLISICPTLSIPQCPQFWSLHLILHSSPENRFISTIFFLRLHLYVLIRYLFSSN